jgi:hypothetical protein
VELAEGEGDKTDMGVAEGVADAIEVSIGVAITVGHAANSQSGPTLPTLLPSGQSFASSVQAV